MTAQIIPIDSECNEWRTEIIQKIQQKLDVIQEEPSMKSFSDITKALFSHKSDILGSIATGLIEKEFHFYLNQQYCDCPHCNKSLKTRGKFKRNIETLSCRIDLFRPYFYCPTCKTGFYPMDEALGLASSSKQHDVQDMEAWLASEMTYEKASETYIRFTGEKISVDHIHGTVKDIACDLNILDVCPSKQEVEKLIEKLGKGKRWRPIMMMAIDGAKEPTRPEPSPWRGKRGKYEYKEAKGFRLYLLDDDKIIHLISWHQIQDDKALAKDLLLIGNAGLIPEEKVRFCVIGDGAPWIWNRIKEIFPKARQVLDFYHCSEYIHKVAKAQYGENTKESQEWLEATFTRLFCDCVYEVLENLNSLEAASDDAKEQIDKTSNYLSNNKPRVQYDSFKRGGYQIGSGAIESANKFICHSRLKRSGAWWYVSNSNNILKLRCAQYNGAYDRIIEKHKMKMQNKLEITGN